MRVRYVDRAAVLAALGDMASQLGAARPEIVEIRLYGSMARGERNVYADADLLIVVESSDVPFVDRSPLYKPSAPPAPLDLTVCTEEELGREVRAGNRFIERALRESRVLYRRAAGSRQPRAAAVDEPARS